MRVIVTNNKKVENKYFEKADVRMLKNSSNLAVVKEARKIAETGGRLLIDPTRKKGYFLSLPFLVDDTNKTSDKKSLQLIDLCIDQLTKSVGQSDSSKEPLLAGIMQNKDLDTLYKILG